jgi:ABC-type transport system involved in multi-copper enzyme maturation permease subunit
MPTISLLYFGLRRLLGPLSGKELRVASRRVRSYALRSSYIVLLCLLMLSAWYSIVGLPDSTMKSLGISRASVVSTYVAVRILVFQFAAAQLLAAVMLCSSLGDELRRGTLGVLLTTPITSLHSVMGKLLGGLLQIVLLLAISVPVLAVLRALGGLSWEDVLAGFLLSLLAIQACLTWYGGIPGRGWMVALYGLSRLVSVGFVLGAGLYFGTRLKTTTKAVAATMVAFLCVNYLIAGPYHPLYPLLWRRITPALSTSGNHASLFFVALTAGPIVVMAVLGLYLLGPARRNVREYVF